MMDNFEGLSELADIHSEGIARLATQPQWKWRCCAIFSGTSGLPGGNGFAGERLLRLVKFNLTTGTFSILGNLALMKLLVDRAHCEYLPANGITIAACSTVNSLLSDRFVFQEGLGLGRKG